VLLPEGDVFGGDEQAVFGGGDHVSTAVRAALWDQARGDGVFAL
jgi:hypothetical protein